MNTLLIYHRGGGKSLDYPPNCILTIKWATKKGAKGIEYDVVAAKFKTEHHLIVIEPKLLKIHKLDINNLQWEDIKNIDAGNSKYGKCKVAKLSKVLTLINQSKTKQQIHVKGNNPKTVSTLVKELKILNNITITSFDLNILQSVKQNQSKLNVGWIVKPDNQSGNEELQDLTKNVTSNPDAHQKYTNKELLQIKENAKSSNIDVIILCAPKIKDKKTIDFFKKDGFEVGAWGVGSNLDIAKKLISFNIDRFTIDNPEELDI